MRNLKRVLSLALALVMVLGMMVITTSAATYADADEITQKEAVEVLTALGIVSGDGTNFNPNGTFTRRDAAKLITYMMIGGDMAEKLAGTDVFTDVDKDHWAAKYIGYCANLGYITGIGDGKFNPKGELKDIELGKLVLCALGNDPAKYTGANWASAVTVDLLEAELVENVTGSVISREDACAMILEAMKYSPTGKVYTVSGVEFDTLYDAIVFGKLTITGFNAATDVTEAPAADCLLTEVYNVRCIGGADDYGRPATTYTDYRNFEMDFVDEPVMTSTKAISNAELYNTLGFKAKVYAAESTLTTTTDTSGFIYCDNTTTYTATGASTLTPATENYGIGANGILTEIYNIDDRTTNNIVEYAVVQIQAQLAEVGTPRKAAATGTRGASTTYPLNLVAGGTVNVVDYTTVVNAALDKDTYNSDVVLAKGDKVLVYGNTDAKYTVAAAESISGTIEKISKGTYTIDGADYKLANNNTATNLTLTGNAGAWYVDAYGYIIGDKAGAAITDYLYVLNTDLQSKTAWGQTTKTLAIQGILPDGTLSVYNVDVTEITARNEAEYEAEYSVSVEQGDYVLTGTDIIVYDADDSSDYNKDDNNVKGLTFRYAADEEGVLTLYAMNSVGGGMTIGATYVATVTNANVNAAAVAANTIVNSDTEYVYYNSRTKKVETYTGAEIRDAFTRISGVAVGKAAASTLVPASVVYVTGGTPVSATAGNTAVFVDASERVDTLDKQGNPLYTYTAYDATGAVVYVTASSTTGIADGLYVPNTDGEISGAPKTTSGVYVVDTASFVGGALKVGRTYFNLADAAVVDLTRNQTGMTTDTFNIHMVKGDGTKVPTTDAVVIYIVD